MEFLHDGRPLRRRARIEVPIIAAATLMLLVPAAARADDTTALKAQMNALMQKLNALAEQNEAQAAQVKALSQQVKDLQAAGSKPAQALTVLPPAHLPTPADKAVAVTEQPGNVFGRSSYPPESANSAPGYPYPAAPTTPYFGAVPTNPVGAGNAVVRLSLSGQVDRTEVYGNDGKAAEFRSLDNNISSSRFRFQGDSLINPTTSAGAIFEMELRPNSSAVTTLTADQSSSVTNFTGGVVPTGGTVATANNTTGVPTVRWADAYITNEDWGALHIGFGGTAGYETAENDLSGTFYAGYVNTADTDGGFSFRQRGLALIPSKAFAGAASVPCTVQVNGASAKTCVASPDAAFGPEVGSVFFYMDGKIRDDRVRYDSPVWNGFQFSASAIDGGATDLALRYGADWWGTTVVASVAETFATSLNHGACASFCYSSGNPSVANAAVGQPTGTALQTSPSAAGSNQFDGSISILHPSGLSLTVAGGVQDPVYKDPLGERVSPNLFYVKGAWQTPAPWFDIGKTAFGVSYTENDELQFANDAAKDYAFLINQNIDPGAAQAFFALHHQTLDRSFATYRPIDLAVVGGIVRF
jgi:hypothetical protein